MCFHPEEVLICAIAGQRPVPAGEERGMTVGSSLCRYPLFLSLHCPLLIAGPGYWSEFPARPTPPVRTWLVFSGLPERISTRGLQARSVPPGLTTLASSIFANVNWAFTQGSVTLTTSPSKIESRHTIATSTHGQGDYIPIIPGYIMLQDGHSGHFPLK